MRTLEVDAHCLRIGLLNGRSDIGAQRRGIHAGIPFAQVNSQSAYGCSKGKLRAKCCCESCFLMVTDGEIQRFSC